MTTWQKLRAVATIVGVLAIITSIFMLVYLLMPAIYQRIGQAPAPLLAYGIDVVLSLFLCILLFSVLGRIFGSRQLAFFQPVIQALEQIAQGNYRVQVDIQREVDEGPFKELVTSVNNVAVELNRIEQMRQEFISNVSHEIQSPLTSIRGFAQALQNERLSEEQRCHYLAIIESESTRLSELAANLLKLASLESDQVKFEPKPYRLDKQIRSLILLSEPQWTSKALEVDVALEELTICADQDLLSQVWLNLIHNSIKFTPPGGRISISLARTGDQGVFIIHDSGIGISAGDQEHVFERFYKADKSRTRSQEGSGLGLSIVQKTVAMHHGAITLASQPGAGTTFTVSLPVEPPPTV